MIVIPPPKPVLRIARIITVDDTGDEAWWDADDLKAAHPELFTTRKETP